MSSVPIHATRGSPSAPRRRASAAGRLALLAVLATLLLGSRDCHAQVTRELDDTDHWVIQGAPPPGSPAAQLQEVQQVLARGDYARAKELATEWCDRFPKDPLYPAALLAKGDAMYRVGDEYNAAFEYEEIARRFPGSPVFVTALQRELDIGIAYAHGLKRKFLGLFRMVNTSDEAQEILIRVQERLPGSELAERAGAELADFYFRNGQMDLAATTYDLFLMNYPQSKQADRARIRLVASSLATFRGPNYSATGLVSARLLLDRILQEQANLARREGARALLLRIRESEATKLLSQLNWYVAQDDRIAAERYLRALVIEYPDTTAMLDALRASPRLLHGLPPHALQDAPDYAALRESFLGKESS
ncbi:MAG: outer membrane protein assembly factor BamD [Planctomycetota bacterium]|nr:outer membrane protein assembly factor BamD [Planctomycetota bacterium]MDA1105545.1 outer membrane protein assembly factor BamD [Planctomycetota bacterium]